MLESFLFYQRKVFAEYTKNYSATSFPSGLVGSLFIEAVPRFERSSNNVYKKGRNLDRCIAMLPQW